ncbi:mitochondrial fission 1 protein A-like [Papaver somniferum]|uniref:mitochondrial fission 1 protein A-like n=1 Tax=Papaver somniferum TaxID=3469 RepID=UPI000E6FDD69|nr:mitochondrial fission 1 protein A-like [Papaver somniferum]
MDLEGVVGRFAGMVVASLIREDNFPLYDVMIHDYKEDLKNYPANTQTDVINDCILKLCRALVHSTGKENVKEGIQKLEDGYRGVLGVLSPLQKREMLYLLAVAYYRDGDYSRSLSYLNQCLEVAPHFNQALTLKKKFGSVLWFLIGGPHQYYLDMILDCERDIAEAGDDAPGEVKNENIIKLSWALVHTRQPEDVLRGIDLLEAPLEKSGLSQLEKGGLNELQFRDMLYIRSLGHYISGDFIKSLNDVLQCLEVAPDFWQGRYLSRTVSTRMKKNKFLGALIFHTAGALVSVIINTKSRRKT